MPVQRKWSTDLEEGRRWGWRQDGDDICEEDMDVDEDDGRAKGDGRAGDDGRAEDGGDDRPLR